MKSYISKKFPLATRKTACIFSLRCSGVSIFPRILRCGRHTPSRRLTRGESSEFRLEADVIRTTDDVVGRRVRGERLAAHEGRTLVANVGDTRHQVDVLDDRPVC